MYNSKAALILPTLLTFAFSCASAQTKTNMSTQHEQKHQPRLDDHLEAELDLAHKDPIKLIGFGDKAWLPYYLNLANDLAYSDNPRVTARLQAEVMDEKMPRIFRLAILQLLGWRSDKMVDEVLISSLTDSTLRPLAAFLLGRIGYKGYPKRDRQARQILTALKQYLDDASTYRDPWYDKTYHTADFIIAAFIRIAGEDKFHFADKEKHGNWIGLELPEFDLAERNNLRSQCKAVKPEDFPETQPACQ